MDQRKIGAFLKKLRNEKNMTQEKLAEQFNVSSRTVSRWETGSNMPDLSILVELADFYSVDIREILNGERKSEEMNQETKETLLQVAEYNGTEKAQLKKRMMNLSIGAFILLGFHSLLELTDGFGRIPAQPCENMQNFVLGATMAYLALSALYFSGILEHMSRWKRKVFRKH